MPRCPNCSRETMRTEDWACQWCGYPLLSGSYKKIAKTYKQLKGERLYKPEPEPEAEQVPESQKKPAPEAEPIPEEIPILLPKSEPVPEAESQKKPAPEAEPIPEEIPILLPKPKREREVEPIQESEPEPEPEPESQKRPVPEAEPIPEEIPILLPKSESEKEPELEPAAMELTVEELLSAYETDEAAADEKFVNNVLRVTGAVAVIDIKDKLETHYIRLTGAEGDLLQSVQCVFNKKHAPALGQLEKGQTVTVQGTYNGSMIAIRMIDCVLVL